MFSRFNDFDRSFDVLDELRRQMDRVWGNLDAQSGFVPAREQSLSAATWPRLNVVDAGATLLVTADVPGLTEKDFEITLDDGVLSIRGERKAFAPEGYEALRRERTAARFARSIALPVKIDAEKTTARVKDGVLTISLAKAPEAKPRQIAVKAGE
jgi:HSP20 family protein